MDRGEKRKSPDEIKAVSPSCAKRAKTPTSSSTSTPSSPPPSSISSLINPRSISETSLELLFNLKSILQRETYDDAAVSDHVKRVRTFFQSGEDHRTAIVLAQMKVLTSLKAIMAKERAAKASSVKNDPCITTYTLLSSNCARRDMENGELYSKRQLDFQNLQAL